MKKIIYIIIVEIKGAAVVTGKLGNLLDGDFFYRFLRVAEVIDPEVFVIGGGIAGAGEIILRIVQKYYRPDVLPAGADIPFELARLGNDAGMYGSMKLLLDSSDEK